VRDRIDADSSWQNWNAGKLVERKKKREEAEASSLLVPKRLLEWVQTGGGAIHRRRGT
jgi:hypothetical protein